MPLVDAASLADHLGVTRSHDIHANRLGPFDQEREKQAVDKLRDALAVVW